MFIYTPLLLPVQCYLNTNIRFVAQCYIRHLCLINITDMVVFIIFLLLTGQIKWGLGVVDGTIRGTKGPCGWRGEEEAEEEGGKWLIGRLWFFDAPGWRLQAVSQQPPREWRRGGWTSWEPGSPSAPHAVLQTAAPKVFIERTLLWSEDTVSLRLLKKIALLFRF